MSHCRVNQPGIFGDAQRHALHHRLYQQSAIEEKEGDLNTKNPLMSFHMPPSQPLICLPATP